MSLKQEIETWVNGLLHYDHNEFDEALQAFESIADTSKILFNCGVIRATLGQHTEAIQCFQRAIMLDPYLAVAYFQQGVSNFLLGDFEEALANFNDTLLYLRGNRHIDYDQLGLKFKLHSCEALFNRGLCYIYLQQKDAGMRDLVFAAKEKVVPDHDVIDEAIREQAEGYTVFSIPVGVIYRPHEAKIKNLRSKDYLGRARLIAQQGEARRQRQNSDLGGHRRNHSAANFISEDRAESQLSYAALNLVKPGLHSSRSRLHSEPPLHRNVFPPTPPPEERSELARAAAMPDGRTADIETASTSSHKRSASTNSSTTSLPSGLDARRPQASKPKCLDLGNSSFHRPNNERAHAAHLEKPRLGTVRSASERPPTRRENSAPDYRGTGQGRDRKSLLVLREDQNTDYTLRPDVYNERSPLSPQNLVYPTSYEPPSRKPHTQQSTQSTLQPTAYNANPVRTQSRTQYSHRPHSIEEEEPEPDAAQKSFSIPFDVAPAPSTGASLATTTHTSTTAADSAYGSYSPTSPREVLAFEIVPPPPHPYQRTQSSSSPQRTRGPVRAEDVQMSKIRVKVYGEKDTRFVMISGSPTFAELLSAIRRKFGSLTFGAGSNKQNNDGQQTDFKIKMRDEEGDMVTMGDQEDLDMAVLAVRSALAEALGREQGGTAGEMGKMEVWVQEIQ